MIASEFRKQDMEFMETLLGAVEFSAQRYLETENEAWKESLVTWNNILEIHKKQMEETDYKKLDAVWDKILNKKHPS